MAQDDTDKDQATGISNIPSFIRNAKLALPVEGPLMSRQDLLSTVDAIKSVLAGTYIHLNSHAPPNKLPHKLLVMIFQQVIPAHTPVSFPAIEHDGYKPILPTLNVITQVCHLWRDIAFGTPSLWTGIDTRACPADDLWSLVQRSEPLPLSIFVDDIYVGTLQAHFRLLRGSSSRWRRLDLAMNNPTPSVIEDLLSFDGSRLHCLTMSSPVIKGQLSGNRDSLPHIMPILQGRTHALEALAIVPCVSWIPANHFPRLTHLYISFGISAKPPEPEDILTLLCNTPFVEIVHFHHLTALEDEALDEPSKPLRVELSRLRSLVFTVSAYHPVVEILNSLSLPPSALIRLDNLFVPYNREAPPSIPAHLAPLHDVMRMELAVEDEMLLLVAEGASSGLWLKVRHEEVAEWNPWIQDLPRMLPLGNLVSLRADVCDLALLGVLRDIVHLSELFVQMAPGPVWLDPEEDTDTDPLVLPLCTLLERSEPIVCPALRSLTIEWLRNMPKSENLGVSDIVVMLAKRSRLGYPIRRLVVQAIPVQFGSIYPTHFSEQLAPLAEHVEEYEECVDPGVHACSFEMRDMWNVEGAEKYWVVEEEQRPRCTGLTSHDCSELYQDR